MLIRVLIKNEHEICFINTKFFASEILLFFLSFKKIRSLKSNGYCLHKIEKILFSTKQKCFIFILDYYIIKKSKEYFQ